MIIKLNNESINVRLDIYLSNKLEITRSQVKNLISDGNIIFNGQCVKAGTLLKENDIIEIKDIEKKENSILAENIKIDIVYEDEDLLVINKAQGMVVHPGAGNYGGTLVNALLYSVKDLSEINGETRPGIVHRLDKETSGLMLVAKNNFAHVNLAKQIETKTCVRKYIALLNGVLKNDSGHIETRFGRHPKERKKMAVLDAGGKIAITDYKVLSYFKKYTLVEFILSTGRTHQIRVHAKYINHTVVGDKVYGTEVKELNGQLLHSHYIEFTHPRTGARLNFSAKLPNYFKNYIEKKTN